MEDFFYLTHETMDLIDKYEWIWGGFSITFALLFFLINQCIFLCVWQFPALSSVDAEPVS